MILKGEPIPAEEAYQFGFLNKVVPQEALIDEARAFTRRFNKLPILAVQIGKAVMDTGINMSLKDALALERPGFSILYSTDDQKEGPKAFLRGAHPNLRADEIWDTLFGYTLDYGGR